MRTHGYAPLLRLSTALALAGAALLVQAQPAPAAPPPAADAPALPAPTLRLPRTHQVWLDALPDTLDAATLDVVLLSPDSLCRPPLQKGLFGMTVNPLNPIAGSLCRRIDSFVTSPPEPLPLAVRVHTPPLALRDAAAVLAALSPAPTRRYVALVHWDWAQAERNLQWLFEVVVIDRDSGRRVWHGARAHEVWPAPEWREKTELRALRALLTRELVRDLLTPRWWRDDLPVPGSRWVTLAELPNYQPAAGRAGLALVNSYTSSNRLQDDAALKLWPAGTPAIDDTEQLRKGDWSEVSTVRRAQTTPLLAPESHVLLDLPAGDYTLRVYTSDEPMTLEAGRITVLNVSRAIGNAKTLSRETESWWRDTALRRHARHAFFAEPPAKGRPPVVPFFLDAAP